MKSDQSGASPKVNQRGRMTPSRRARLCSSCFILHPSSFILHPSSFILHPSGGDACCPVVTRPQRLAPQLLHLRGVIPKEATVNPRMHFIAAAVAAAFAATGYAQTGPGTLSEQTQASATRQIEAEHKAAIDRCATL